VHGEFSSTGLCNALLKYRILNAILKLVNAIVSLACHNFNFAYHCFHWSHWLISLFLLTLGNGSLHSQILYTST
jgi:hypothetical protein